MKRILAALCIFVFSTPLFGNEKEGGIIGTGVVGQITGLSTFEVSGMRFNLPTEVSLEGVEDLGDLRLGMTLVIEAAPDGNAWQATQIRRMPALTGPVTGPQEVMGVPVSGNLPDAGVVTVDGFWSKTGLVASHVSASGSDTQMVNGVYNAKLQTVGLMKVTGNLPAEGADGELITVFGQFRDGLLVVDRTDAKIFAGDLPDLLLVEGFYSRPDEQNEIRLNGVALSTMEAEGNLDMTQIVRRCSLRGRVDFSRATLSAEDRATIDSFCVSVPSL